MPPQSRLPPSTPNSSWLGRFRCIWRCIRRRQQVLKKRGRLWPTSTLGPSGAENASTSISSRPGPGPMESGSELRAYLERGLVHDPNDLLALKVAQDLSFFLGDRNGLKDVVERVHRAWSPERAGYGYVCGMYAFGLEENGLYEAAQEQTRMALQRNSGDVWAVHAQAHVFEMQGEPQSGTAFLDHTEGDWTQSYFAIHNWWHRALITLSWVSSSKSSLSTTVPSVGRDRANGSTSSMRRRCSGAFTSTASTSRPGRSC